VETEFVNKIVKAVLAKLNPYLQLYHEKPIPIGVSNRHVHLSKEDLEVLFGQGYELNRVKELSQPGQYACAETVILAGPKGCIEQVRILGPVRSQTQVEVLRSDSFRLGVNAFVRESGSLNGTEGITLIGPKGSVQLTEGVIAAQRHIHMTPEDAICYGVTDGQLVALKIGGLRGLVFDQVLIRVSRSFSLECHIDMDEANAAGANTGAPGYLCGISNGSIPASSARPDNSFRFVHSADSFRFTQPENNLGSELPFKLITEATVREALKKGVKLRVCKDTIYTPLARDVIKELKAETILTMASIPD